MKMWLSPGDSHILHLLTNTAEGVMMAPEVFL